jgi:hypothetical protein
VLLQWRIAHKDEFDFGGQRDQQQKRRKTNYELWDEAAIHLNALVAPKTLRHYSGRQCEDKMLLLKSKYLVRARVASRAF